VQHKGRSIQSGRGSHAVGLHGFPCSTGRMVRCLVMFDTMQALLVLVGLFAIAFIQYKTPEPDQPELLDR